METMSDQALPAPGVGQRLGIYKMDERKVSLCNDLPIDLIICY